MPSNEIFYPNTATCIGNDSYTITACPVIATSCIPMDLSCLWIATEEDSYNCNKCGSDIEFCIPYEASDEIMIQTQLPDLVSGNPADPTAGFFGQTVPAAFRAQLLDADGVVVSSDVTTFSSDNMAAFSTGAADVATNYQIIVLDTALILATYGLTCFSIRVNSFESDGVTENRVVYSECFEQVTCNKDTVLVCGQWDDFDCCGNYYGRPVRGFAGSPATPIVFDNSMRYYAGIINDSSNVEKTVFSNRVTKSVIDNIYLFSLDRAIPPYMKNIFVNQHYGGLTVKMDGDIYLANSQSIDNRMSNKSGTMFLFDVELTLQCEKDFNCT